MMKKDNAIKFSLTLVASVILAACSSGGSGSSDAPAQNNVSNETTQQVVTPAEETTTQEETVAPAGNTEPSPVGYKVVNKTNSDFQVKGRADEGRNSVAGVVESMLTQKPEPSFDTLVIAAPTNKAGNTSIAYVEDLDVTEQADGVGKLQHIYLGAQTKEGGEARSDVHNEYGNITKTETQGTETGSVLVYEANRQNYTDDHADNRSATKEDTVAELYGRNTMGSDKVVNATANLPLADHYGELATKRGDGHLQLVQYGRVTTALDSSNLQDGDKTLAANFKDGVKLAGDLKSYVVGYAQYNDVSKEDNYFARGINNISAEDLAKLEGKLTYKGHAVTYGLDHSIHGLKDVDAKNAPTSLQAVNPDEVEFVSGTHVLADVDLGSRKVDGKLYDMFTVNGADHESKLVKFNGDLAANGAITGTSELAYGQVDAANREGTFNATIYGNKEVGLDKTELGGAVASNVGGEGKWGAVFGAEDVTDKVIAPTPVEPSNPLGQAENAEQGRGTVNKVN
ncbi:transferrin-binding protein-like solute binding protein [Avibacterium avium]|uniref:transferrin-binding protein-like solute binding protein n=2 Tax=Avibacterium TaxID=292486 RepID=UPI003BF8FC0A